MKEFGKKNAEAWLESLKELAHDLASPLSFLEIYINSLACPKNDVSLDGVDIGQVAKKSFEKVKEILGHIRNSCENGSDIIANEYEDFSKVIGGVIAELTPLSKERNVTIKYFGPKHLIGNFSKTRVERVIANLVVNAIESMKKSGGEIVISAAHHGDTIWIDISDNGRGIAKSVLPNIFDNGFTRGKKNGNGIGLAFCKKVMNEHRGQIHVHSKRGRGSTFSLVFPKTAIVAVDDVNLNEVEIRVVRSDLGEHIEAARNVIESLDDKNITLVDCDCDTAGVKDITLDPV